MAVKKKTTCSNDILKIENTSFQLTSVSARPLKMCHAKKTKNWHKSMKQNEVNVMRLEFGGKTIAGLSVTS